MEVQMSLNLLVSFIYLFFFLFIYSHVHTLGHFSPLPPAPTLSPLPHPRFQAESVLPLSLILLKRRHKHNKKDKAFLLVELRTAIKRDSKHYFHVQMCSTQVDSSLTDLYTGSWSPSHPCLFWKTFSGTHETNIFVARYSYFEGQSLQFLIKKINFTEHGDVQTRRTGAWLKWQRACLASMSPWVQSLVLPKRRKEGSGKERKVRKEGKKEKERREGGKKGR
jgi:hypothetical protein